MLNGRVIINCKLDYLRTRSAGSESPSSTSIWDFIGKIDHWERDWLHVNKMIRARFGKNPWDPSANQDRIICNPAGKEARKEERGK